MAVPEATVHKYGDTWPAERQVGASNRTAKVEAPSPQTGAPERRA
jgi:hypothetical protein